MAKPSQISHWLAPTVRTWSASRMAFRPSTKPGLQGCSFSPSITSWTARLFPPVVPAVVDVRVVAVLVDQVPVDLPEHGGPDVADPVRHREDAGRHFDHQRAVGPPVDGHVGGVRRRTDARRPPDPGSSRTCRCHAASSPCRPRRTVRERANQSLQPSPICSWFWRQVVVDGPAGQPVADAVAVLMDDHPVIQVGVAVEGTRGRKRGVDRRVRLHGGARVEADTRGRDRHVGSVPAMPNAGPPAVLAMMAAIAPSSCAFLTFDDEGAGAAVDERDLAVWIRQIRVVGIGGTLPTG